MILKVLITVFNATGNSDPLDFPGNIAPLATVQKDVTTSAISAATKVEVTPYVTDDSGENVYCTTTDYTI